MHATRTLLLVAALWVNHSVCAISEEGKLTEQEAKQMLMIIALTKETTICVAEHVSKDARLVTDDDLPMLAAEFMETTCLQTAQHMVATVKRYSDEETSKKFLDKYLLGLPYYVRHYMGAVE